MCVMVTLLNPTTEQRVWCYEHRYQCHIAIEVNHVSLSESFEREGVVAVGSIPAHVSLFVSILQQQTFCCLVHLQMATFLHYEVHSSINRYCSRCVFTRSP
jgi:hypothetical protein